MTTQTIMKARIADELARDDLTSQIAYAIGDAIAAYDDSELAFNESRANTFTTTASDSDYTSSDESEIANLVKIEFMTIYDGSVSLLLTPTTQQRMETLLTTGTVSGRPISYAFYNETIYLYPIPDAAYTIRIGGTFRVAAPASDSETGNPWMTTAERLIRCRAKAELYAHVIRNDSEASKMMQLAEEAFMQLKSTSNRLRRTGENIVEPMEF